MGLAAAAGIGAVASIGGGLIASSSASDAANAQIQASQNAQATQLAMFNQTQANEAPFMQAGQTSLAALMQGLGLMPGSNGATANGAITAPFNYQASPGYNYEVQQSMDAIQNSAAAKGGLVSGNALKALQANAQGLASTDYQSMANLDMNQKQQLFNMLQTMAGSGQNAAANLGSLGSSTANSIASAQIGAGNAAAAGSVAQGNIWSNLLNNQSFLSGITSMFGSGNTGTFAPSTASLGGGGEWV